MQLPAPPPISSTKTGALAPRSLRLHYFSTDFDAAFDRRLQQPDGRIQRSRAEVHVPLRRPEILMAGEFLNRSYGSTAHHQVRTERVPQNVRTVVSQISFPRRPADQVLHELFGQWSRIVADENPLTAQVTMVA